MLESDSLVEELSEAQCRLTDRLNQLLDDEFSGRTLTSREVAFARRISEHITIAEGLADTLGKGLKNG